MANTSAVNIAFSSSGMKNEKNTKELVRFAEMLMVLIDYCREPVTHSMPMEEYNSDPAKNLRTMDLHHWDQGKVQRRKPANRKQHKLQQPRQGRKH